MCSARFLDRFPGGGSRCFGRKAIPAMSVGTTALAMTAATRKEYCAWVTMPWVNPYRAEVVGVVSPDGAVYEGDPLPDIGVAGYQIGGQ